MCAGRGEQTKQPFPCIRYFFIRPVVRLFARERLRDYLDAAFFRTGWKEEGRNRRDDT